MFVVLVGFLGFERKKKSVKENTGFLLFFVILDFVFLFDSKNLFFFLNFFQMNAKKHEWYKKQKKFFFL